VGDHVSYPVIMATTDATQTINRQIGGNPLGNAFGVYSGLQKGGVQGYGTALADVGKLSGSAYGGLLGNTLGIYSGLQRGGVQGYGTAAVDALKLAGSGAANYVAAPLAVYNFAKNWQSGATGSDALQGAEAGAAIGSIVPGVGTLIGGAIGGVVGAISSVFGGGRTDPENVNFDQMYQAYNKAKNPVQGQAIVNSIPNKYLSLAGLFDLRGNQITGNIPIYNKYGRMGEQQFTIDMTDKINQALAAGTISQKDNAQTIMQKVVTPWINSFGKGQWTDPNTNAINALLQGMVQDYTTGNYRKWNAVGGDYPFANTIKPFGALGVGQSTQPAPKLTQPKVASKSMADPNRMYAGGPGGDQITSAFSGAGDLGNLSGVTSGTPSATPGITGPAATPAASSGGIGSFLGDLGGGFLGSLLGSGGGGGGLGSQLGNFLGGIAPSAATAAIGMNQISQAQQQNQQYQQQEAALGQPFLDASKQQLAAYQGGQLSPAQQAVVNTSQQQGQNLLNQTGPLQQIFQQSFQNYQSGTLQPAQQAQLDQQIAAAKAELRQALGPNADSSTLATQDAQIDQQALITKQNMLNSQFQTGNQAYDTWMTSTQQGQQLILQGQQYAAQQLQQDLTNALQLGSEGMAPVEQSINMAISSDADLSNQVNQLMSNLAASWAYMQAKGSSAGAGGGGLFGGGGGGGLAGAAGNIVGQYGFGNLSGLLPQAQDPSSLQSPFDPSQWQDPSNLGIDPSILNQGNILDQTGDISSPTYDWLSGSDPGSFDATALGG
jgi:hypothetical protein